MRFLALSVLVGCAGADPAGKASHPAGTTSSATSSTTVPGATATAASFDPAPDIRIVGGAGNPGSPSVGDFDGDGQADLLVVAWGGGPRLFRGPLTPGDHSTADADGRLGLAGGMGAIIGGDLDSDGADELWVTADADPWAGTFLVDAPLTGEGDPGDALASTPDALPLLADIDLDGDGWPDTVTIGWGPSWQVALGIAYGPFNGELPAGSAFVPGPSSTVIDLSCLADSVDWTAFPIGDIDGDGRAEFALAWWTSWLDSTPDCGGGGWIFEPGPPGSLLTPADAVATLPVRSTPAPVGDHDGDGFPDLRLTTWDAEIPYDVVYSSRDLEAAGSAEAATPMVTISQDRGSFVGWLPDVTGDGRSEIVVMDHDQGHEMMWRSEAESGADPAADAVATSLKATDAADLDGDGVPDVIGEVGDDLTLPIWSGAALRSALGG